MPIQTKQQLLERIQDYFGVDYDIVWDVVTEQIPLLASEIEQMLKSQSK